jgi:hypothetical protein
VPLPTPLPTLVPTPGADLPPARGEGLRSLRHARFPNCLPPAVVGVHLACLAMAFLFWAYLDRNLWFFGDEWDFLTRRGLHGASFSLWAPHNEHWSVLPILLWRAIYSLEHLSSYWPYLVPLLMAHVAVVHLLWRRCLREGADPWVATALATLFAFLGAGAEDLVWAFQIGFLASLLFGLLAMEVAEGQLLPWKYRALLPLPSLPGLSPSGSLPPGAVLTARAAPSQASPAEQPALLVSDLLASALALAALMCSSVGVASCAALGAFLLARSGWRRTVVVLSVPVGAYVTWFAFAGQSGFKATGDYMSLSVFLHVPVFVESNLANDLGHAAGWGRLGSFLATAVLLWVVLSYRGLLKRHPAVFGGALGAAVFYALAAVGRDRISPTLTPSRYAYVGVAFLLPALALMLTGVRDAASRSRPATSAVGGSRASWSYVRRVMVLPVILAFLAAATLGNVVLGVRFARSRTMYVRGLEDQIITSAALLQDDEQMTRAVNPYPIWASGRASGYLTPEVLANLYRARLLPRPHRTFMSPTEILNDQTWMDVSGTSRPMSRGHFRFLGSVDVTWVRIGPDLLLGSRTDARRVDRPRHIGLYLGGAEMDRAFLVVGTYELRRDFLVRRAAYERGAYEGADYRAPGYGRTAYQGAGYVSAADARADETPRNGGDLRRTPVTPVTQGGPGVEGRLSVSFRPGARVWAFGAGARDDALRLGARVEDFTLGPRAEAFMLSARLGARHPGSGRVAFSWPSGPGGCALATRGTEHFGRGFAPSLRFGLAPGASAASLWVSLGKAGGTVVVFLAHPWGLEGLPGDVALQGQAIDVPAGGHAWVNDTAVGDDLVLQLPVRSLGAEICGLSPSVGLAAAA